MPWVKGTDMDNKRLFLLEFITGQFNVTELAKRYNVSRKTAHELINRFHKEGFEAVKDRPPVAKSCPHKTPDKIVEMILAVKKKNRRYGARKIKAIIERENPQMTIPPASTINSILARKGLTNQPKRIRRIKPQGKYFEATKPNQIWTIDFKGDFKLPSEERCYPLTVCDMKSRFILGIKAMPRARLQPSKRFFIKLFRKYGLPQYILSDNGRPFASPMSVARLSRLSVWFIKLGITPLFIDPGAPQQNGNTKGCTVS